MTDTLPRSRIRRFFDELRRRKVLRVGVMYLIGSWAAIEVASVVFPELMLPDWSVRLLIVLAAFGFPFVVVLAWVFDITPEGVQRTPPVTAPEAPAIRPPAPGQSLAVLPFRNIGGDQENEYFCEGLAEDLLIVLSRVRGLRVAARSSSFAFRDHSSDVRTIGEKLNVASILEGSVRKSGNQLRIAVRLVDTANGFQRWTEVFDRELGDIFRIQDEISRAVYDALNVEVYGAERPRIDPGTRDTDAYNLYLMGRHQFHKRSEESLQSALRFFRQATERDPSFALPYTGLADAYSLLSNSGEGYGRMPLEESIALATPMVERALALEPRLAEAHASLGFLNRLRQDYDGAERALRKALELNPDYPMAHIWLGLTLYDQRRLRDARAEFARACEADPLSPIAGSNMGYAHLKFGEFDAAREQFQRVIEIAPEFPVPYSGMAEIERRLGRPEAARQWWERAMRVNPNRAYYPTCIALLSLDQDDVEGAQRSLHRAEQLSPNHPSVVRAHMAVLIAAGRDAELVAFTEDRLAGEHSSAETLANAAVAQLMAGRAETALDYYQRAGGDLLPWVSDAVVWGWRFAHGLHLADVMLRLGQRERGADLLGKAHRLLDGLESEGLVNPELDYHRAAVHALQGDDGRAGIALERALERGWSARWWAHRDPSLAGLRERGGMAAVDRAAPSAE